MNNKILIVISSVIAVIIAIALIIYIVSTKFENVDKVDIEDGQIFVETNIGEVEIDDLYTEDSVLLSNNAVLFSDQNNYSIMFFPDDASFIISIKDGNINEVRKRAEADFLSKTNITEQEACQLDVTLAVLWTADINAAGTGYGLSFCSNGVSLP